MTDTTDTTVSHIITLPAGQREVLKALGLTPKLLTLCGAEVTLELDDDRNPICPDCFKDYERVYVALVAMNDNMLDVISKINGAIGGGYDEHQRLDAEISSVLNENEVENEHRIAGVLAEQE